MPGTPFVFLPPDQLTRARSLFPHIPTGRLYLNHAATSPLSSNVIQAMTGYLRERSAGAIETYAHDLRAYAACRDAIRKIINAESGDRIAFVGNTSDGLNIVSSGLAWKSGDRILLNDMEFPANVHPYFHLRTQGVEIDVLKADRGRVTAEMVERAIRPRTRVVALSAVQFLSGYRADLGTIGEICRRKSVRFIIDGIQAVGAIQIDVQRMKIDALSAGAQKWLMSPQGTGFLYVTESLQEELRQRYVGWLSVEDPWQFARFDQPLARSARRYEGGTLNVIGLLGVKAALDTLLEIGMEHVESHIMAATGLLVEHIRNLDRCELYSPAEAAERAGIVTVRLPGRFDPGQVFEHLERQRINISLREGKLRFSPHFYNSPDEVEKAFAAVHELISNG